MLFLPQGMPAINILRKEGADIATFDKTISLDFRKKHCESCF